VCKDLSRRGNFPVLRKKTSSTLKRKISPTVNTPTLSPTIRKYQYIAKLRVSRPKAVRKNAMTTGDWATDLQEAILCWVIHALIPVDTENYWTLTDNPIDGVIDTEAPPVLEEIVSTLTRLHTCQDSGTLVEVASLTGIDSASSSINLLTGLIGHVIAVWLSGKLSRTTEAHTGTLSTLIKWAVLTRGPHTLVARSPTDQLPSPVGAGALVLKEMNIELWSCVWSSHLALTSVSVIGEGILP
jgi:hypothetical protein